MYKCFILIVVLMNIGVFGCSREREINGDVFIVTNSGQSVKLGLVNILVFSEQDVNSCVNKKTLDWMWEKNNLSKELDSSRNKLDELLAENKHMELSIELHIEAMKYRPKDIKKDRDYLEKRMRDYSVSEDNVKKASLNLSSIKDKYDSFDRGAFISVCIDQKNVVKALTNADGRFSLVVPNSDRIAILATSRRSVEGATEDYYWYIWVNKDENNIMLSNNNLFETYCSACVVGVDGK